MPYSQFTLETVESTFSLSILENKEMFLNVPESDYSELLQKILDYNIPLALEIATEKARSEMLITPILIEIKQQFNSQISLFSGKEFNVDPEKGLVGYCDFLLSKSSSQLMIKSPVAVLIEAKNDNIQLGLGQCIAEMIAAQLFNQKRGNSISTVYGGVTTGTNWKFMRLRDKIVEIDPNEYFLNQLRKIIGILKSFLQ